MGGTHTRCALLDLAGRTTAPVVYENRAFPAPEALFTDYVRSLPRRPDSALLAVAAPVSGNEANMVNIDWHVSGPRLCEQLGWQRVELVNDFVALAHALPALGPPDLHPAGGDRPAERAPRIVLGPGTGLGTAALVQCDGHELALAGEGGHTTLPAATEEEARVIAFARARHGHCSAERLLSGPGLSLLHEALHGQAGVAAADIAARAEAGDAAAGASLEMLFQLLGTLAGNLALLFDARGGVYIAGGIIPRHIARFTASGFRERFVDKGRYRNWLAAIPAWVITARHPALTGLARHAQRLGSG